MPYFIRFWYADANYAWIRGITFCAAQRKYVKGSNFLRMEQYVCEILTFAVLV